MKKSKKIFIAFCVLFVLILLYIGYDISTRTTFPGGRNNNENIEKNEPEAPADSLSILENT